MRLVVYTRFPLFCCCPSLSFLLLLVVQDALAWPAPPPAHLLPGFQETCGAPLHALLWSSLWHLLGHPLAQPNSLDNRETGGCAQESQLCLTPHGITAGNHRGRHPHMQAGNSNGADGWGLNSDAARCSRRLGPQDGFQRPLLLGNGAGVKEGAAGSREMASFTAFTVDVVHGHTVVLYGTRAGAVYGVTVHSSLFPLSLFICTLASEAVWMSV